MLANADGVNLIAVGLVSGGRLAPELAEPGPPAGPGVLPCPALPLLQAAILSTMAEAMRRAKIFFFIMISSFQMRCLSTFMQACLTL